MIRHVSRHLRRVAIGAVGLGVLVGGLILLPLPIPLGVVLIPTGLIILATEVPIARRALDLIQERTGPFGRGVRAAETTAIRWASRVTRPAGAGADASGQPAPEARPGSGGSDNAGGSRAHTLGSPPPERRVPRDAANRRA